MWPLVLSSLRGVRKFASPHSSVCVRTRRPHRGLRSPGCRDTLASCVTQFYDFSVYAVQIADIPVPQILEEMMEVVRIFPRTRQNRTVEQIVDVSFPQVKEKIVEVIGRPPRANTPVACMVTSPRRRLRWTILWIRRARALRTRRRAASSWRVWTWS